MRQSWLVGCAWLVVLASVGCEQRAEVTFEIHTDLVAGVTFDAIRVSGSGDLTVGALARDYRPGVRLDGIALPAGDAAFRIALLLRGGEVLGRNYAFRASGPNLVPIWFLASCRGVTCPAAGDAMEATECEGGRCVAPACTPANPEFCPDEPACVTRADCTPMPSSCGATECLSGLCVFVSDPARCTGALACDPVAGCVMPVATDAGMPDAGMDAPRDDVPGLDAPDVPSLDEGMPLDIPGLEVGGGTDAPVECTSPAECADGNPCTRDGCESGMCRSVPDDALPYDDANPCTVGDRCSGGAVVDGTPLDCDDGVACTTDFCSGGACNHPPVDGVCTAASGGRCDAVLGCQYPVCNATTCSPSDACETAVCMAETCVRAPVCGTRSLCCDGACCPDDGNECTTDACSGSTCLRINNSNPCDDGISCTSDQCSGGSCVGTPGSCDDFNVCTADSCGPMGCAHTPVAASCPPMNACVETAACMAGTCTPVTFVTCPDDGNPCTDQVCHPFFGCQYFPAVAGTACDQCTPGTCDGAGNCNVPICPIPNICCPDGRCVPNFGFC